MDRAQLFRDVAVELNRQDKTDLIPGWLTSAEFRLNALLRAREMVTLAMLPVAANLFPAPADFLEAESMSVAAATDDPVRRGPSRGALFYIPASEVDAYPERYISERPHWYTTRGNYFELVGWSVDRPFQIQLFYFAELSPLATNGDTNWLLEKAPHMYRNAMLHFGYMHLEEFDTANLFLQTVAAEAAALNERAVANKYGSGPLIKQPARKMGGRFS